MSKFSFKGKIIAEEEERRGVSASGNEWRTKGYVIQEETDYYPMKFKFDVWNDNIDKCAIKLGESLTVDFYLDVREHQGKHYNSIRVNNVTREEAEQPEPEQKPAEKPAPAAELFPKTDDVPF